MSSKAKKVTDPERVVRLKDLEKHLALRDRAIMGLHKRVLALEAGQSGVSWWSRLVARVTRKAA